MDINLVFMAVYHEVPKVFPYKKEEHAGIFKKYFCENSWDTVWLVRVDAIMDF